MSAESTLRSALTGASAVTALVGTRIYPDEAPPNPTVPYVVYQRISTDPSVTHDQSSASSKHLDGVRMQVTVLAASQLACLGVLHQVRLATERNSTLKAIWLDERSVPRDDAAQVHGRQADFLVWVDPD